MSRTIYKFIQVDQTGGTKDNMKRVVLVRHGQSSANKNGTIQGGDADTHLTDLGEEQSIKCGKFLKKYFTFDTVWCSPLIRAKRTAELVCGEIDFDYDQVRYFDDIIERRHGKILAGKTQDEMYKLPDIGPKIRKLDDKIDQLSLIEQRDGKDEQYLDKIMKLTSGESGKEFQSRIQTFIDMMTSHMKEPDSGNLLVVAHGQVIWNLLQLMTGHTRVAHEFGKQTNCSVTVINYDKLNVPNIVMAQYTKYLDDKKDTIKPN